jgi:hypothetical protein
MKIPGKSAFFYAAAICITLILLMPVAAHTQIHAAAATALPSGSHEEYQIARTFTELAAKDMVYDIKQKFVYRIQLPKDQFDTIQVNELLTRPNTFAWWLVSNGCDRDHICLDFNAGQDQAGKKYLVVSNLKIGRKIPAYKFFILGFSFNIQSCGREC